MLKIGSTATLVSDYSVLYSEDPAIDRTVEGFAEIWEEYLRTGDFSKLKFFPGQEPTIFKLRHLRGRSRRLLQDRFRSTAHDGITPSNIYDACQAALVGCENFLDENGTEFEVELVYDKKTNSDRVSDDTMARLELIRDSDGNEGALVNELGIRAIMSMAPDPL